MTLTQVQLRQIDITEKVGSAVSVCGAAFIIFTFIFGDKFRKPINRLVFYAAWGNIATNVATLIGRSGIAAGVDSNLCRFQAFFIQWFMLADALWTFCMAVNVYLSFFRYYDSASLRKLEWRYILFCYGTPLVSGITYFFVTTEKRGHVYGDATLWCWISIKWDFLRVLTFYGPAWLAILLTFVIYIRVGALIWHWRSQLLMLAQQPDRPQRVERRLESTIMKTNEVIITHEPRDEHDAENAHIAQLGRDMQEKRRPTLTKNGRGRTQSTMASGFNANKAAYRYARTAVLFFFALLCTWVPSSVNRVGTLVHPGHTPFGPAFAAALVLPLQGLWNAIVYIVTSWWACKCLWHQVTAWAGLPARSRETSGSLVSSRVSELRSESDDTSLRPWDSHALPSCTRTPSSDDDTSYP